MQWFFKKVWTSKWYTAIPMSCLQDSISIKEKNESYAKKDMDWICLGEAKSASISRTRESERGVGTDATWKGTDRKEVRCTATHRPCRRHHLLWTNMGCLCLQSTTPREEHMVDWCGTRSHGNVPLRTEDTWRAWVDIPSSGCWRKTRHAQGIWGNTDTSVPVSSDAYGDEVPHEKTWNTGRTNTSCNHVATDKEYWKRIHHTPHWLEEDVPVHPHRQDVCPRYKALVLYPQENSKCIPEYGAQSSVSLYVSKVPWTHHSKYHQLTRRIVHPFERQG